MIFSLRIVYRYRTGHVSDMVIPNFDLYTHIHIADFGSISLVVEYIHDLPTSLNMLNSPNHYTKLVEYRLRHRVDIFVISQTDTPFRKNAS